MNTMRHPGNTNGSSSEKNMVSWITSKITCDNIILQYSSCPAWRKQIDIDAISGGKVQLLPGKAIDIRWEIFRQMLKMQDVPCDEFVCNARGMDPALNFPTSFCNRKKIHQQPASENETKALIRIFQEYASRGLLVFCSSGKKIIYYRQEQGFSAGQKGYRLARHLKKCTRGKLERYSMDYEKQSDRRNMGRPEQFYGETIHQPAFRIEIPVTGKNREEEKKEIQEIMMIPLECIYSLTQQ